MNFINLHTDFLRSETYLGAEPIERATWLNLLAWCASQENGGVIKGAKTWTDRKWQQLCGITLKEVETMSELYAFSGDNLVVFSYPVEKEAEVKAKREAGKKGGRPKKTKTLEPSKNKEEKPHGCDKLSSDSNHQPERAETEREGKEKDKGKGKDKVEKEAQAPSPSAPLPHGSQFLKAWKIWGKHRSEIKKPLRPTMIEQQLEMLGAMTETAACDIIYHTVGNGWQGLRAKDEIAVKKFKQGGGHNDNADFTSIPRRDDEPRLDI